MKDEAIIQAIRNGDEHAIDSVITAYSRLLWTVAARVLQNAASDQDIEECVADAFIYLWQHPERFDPARGRLKSWLSVVARSRAIDRYRELSRSSALPLDEGLLSRQLGLAEGLIARDARKALLEGLDALEETERDVLVRRYCYDQKPREIAAALDMPAKRVENCLYRGKRRLRELIETKGV